MTDCGIGSPSDRRFRHTLDSARDGGFKLVTQSTHRDLLILSTSFRGFPQTDNPATFSVPARRLFSWLPPKSEGRKAERRFT